MGLGYLFEAGFLFFLILGVILAISINSAVLHAIIILIFGILAATESNLRKTDLNFPYVLIIVGFILGYLIASKGNKFFLIILFILGIIAGIYIKKWIKLYGYPEDDEPEHRRKIRNI